MQGNGVQGARVQRDGWTGVGAGGGLEERQFVKEQGSMIKEIEPGGRVGLGKDGVRVAGLEERR